MKLDSNSIIIALLALILGSLMGYYFGASRSTSSSQMPMNMHGAMSGMTMGLEGKTGAALEEAFLDEMIVHHQGAIEMSQALLKGTSRPELVKLANDIISAQTAEIAQMKEWRMSWFGR